MAICGGGPTGLTLSALLAKFGVPSMLFERSTMLPQHPQARCRDCLCMLEHSLEARMCLCDNCSTTAFVLRCLIPS